MKHPRRDPVDVPVLKEARVEFNRRFFPVFLVA